MFECQDGPHRVGASLPGRRCWLFLLLIRHSKGNTGISDYACCFCSFPGCLCSPKTQPPAGCLQPIRAHGPERKHAKPSAPCFSEPSGLNPFCMARRDDARKLGSLGPGGKWGHSHSPAVLLTLQLPPQVTSGPRHQPPSRFPFPRACG